MNTNGAGIDTFSERRNVPASVDARWATTLLERAMTRLEAECLANHMGDLFSRANRLLSGERGDGSYSELATTLTMSEGAVRVAIHRLRQRYGELVREEIAHTVATPGEVDEELRYW